jgi:hypothetical protein
MNGTSQALGKFGGLDNNVFIRGAASGGDCSGSSAGAWGSVGAGCVGVTSIISSRSFGMRAGSGKRHRQAAGIAEPPIGTKQFKPPGGAPWDFAPRLARYPVSEAPYRPSRLSIVVEATAADHAAGP